MRLPAPLRAGSPLVILLMPWYRPRQSLGWETLDWRHGSGVAGRGWEESGMGDHIPATIPKRLLGVHTPVGLRHSHTFYGSEGATIH